MNNFPVLPAMPPVAADPVVVNDIGPVRLFPMLSAIVPRRPADRR
jgi:hypothetical protein